MEMVNFRTMKETVPSLLLSVCSLDMTWTNGNIIFFGKGQQVLSMFLNDNYARITDGAEKFQMVQDTMPTM